MVFILGPTVLTPEEGEVVLPVTLTLDDAKRPSRRPAC